MTIGDGWVARLGSPRSLRLVCGDEVRDLPGRVGVGSGMRDVGEHELATFVGDELSALPACFAAFDVLGAIDVRGLFRVAGYEPGGRPPAELGPPR